MATIPDKKSPKWLLASFISTFMNAIIMFITIFVISLLERRSIFDGTMLVILFIVAIINLLFAFIGFLGARYTFFYGNYALLFGTLIAAIYVTQDFSGWEYFTSTMALVLLTGFGLIVGIIFDIINRKKSKNGPTKFEINKFFMIVFTVLLIIPIFISAIDLFS